MAGFLRLNPHSGIAKSCPICPLGAGWWGPRGVDRSSLLSQREPEEVGLGAVAGSLMVGWSVVGAQPGARRVYSSSARGSTSEAWRAAHWRTGPAAACGGRQSARCGGGLMRRCVVGGRVAGALASGAWREVGRAAASTRSWRGAPGRQSARRAARMPPMLRRQDGPLREERHGSHGFWSGQEACPVGSSGSVRAGHRAQCESIRIRYVSGRIVPRALARSVSARATCEAWRGRPTSAVGFSFSHPKLWRRPVPVVQAIPAGMSHMGQVAACVPPPESGSSRPPPPLAGEPAAALACARRGAQRHRAPRLLSPPPPHGPRSESLVGRGAAARQWTVARCSRPALRGTAVSWRDYVQSGQRLSGRGRAKRPMPLALVLESKPPYP